MYNVEIDHLKFSYEQNVPVIKDISLKINSGEYVSILGHNGSGKSTIAKLMIGLLEKEAGDIKICGISLNEETVYDVRKHVGIVFQNPDNQFIGSTVRDDIAFGLENRCVPQREMDDIINKYATEVGMYEYLNHEPTKLSGGQKQRVAIAGILAMHPDILILDESTSMLDPKGKSEINQLVKKICSDTNMTVISITHDIEEASLSDRIILLNDGKILADDKPEIVLSNHKLLEQTGLEAPFTYKVINALKNKKIHVENTLDMKELVEQLWQLNSKK